MIYEGPIRVTADEAAAILKVPTGTIRRWASEDQWRRYHYQRRRHWELEQVQDSYDRRRRAELDNRACA